MHARTIASRPGLALLLGLMAAYPSHAEGVGKGGLSLGDALGMALRREPDFQVSRLSIPIADAAVNRERAGWDLFFSGRADFRDEETVASTGLDGAQVRETDNRAVEAGLTKPLHDGSSVSLTATDNRNLTNSSFALLNPAYRTGVQVSYRRPLAQGSGRDSTYRGLRRAEIGLERAALDLRQAVLDLLTRTERAYWSLASARERADVARLALQEAEQLLTWNKDRVEAGALARVAVIEAEAAVAARRTALLDARRSVENAQLEMLRLVDPPARPGRVLPDLESRPGAALPEVPSHDELLGKAFEHFPAYRQALLGLRENEVEVAFARDAVLPRIDLVATMEANGLGSNRGNSLDLTSSLDFPSYFVGVSWEVPLGRRAARSELRRRRLELERSIRRVRSVEVDLENSIQSALRRYRINAEAQKVAHAAVVAAEAKLEAERARYQEGMITADDLLRFQRELAERRASEVEARTRTSLSAMDLWASAGLLPERRGVGLDDLGLQVPEL